MNNWLRTALIAVPLLVLVAGVGLSGFMAYRQATTWIYPARSIPEEAPAGVANWEDVDFRTSDGLTIRGWFIPADVESAPAVILLHGLGANRAALLDEAALLTAQGFHTLLIDLRNHGRSDGDVTTLGYQEIEDVRGAVAYLLGREDVDAERIGVAGFSLGGTTALRAAARIPEIRAVAAISAFHSVDDTVTPIVQALTGRPPLPFPAAVTMMVNLLSGVNVSEVRPVDDLPQIAPRPLLFVHGADDVVVPASSSEVMFAAAAEPKDLLIIPQAGHGGFSESGEFEQRFVGFFNQHLKP